MAYPRGTPFLFQLYDFAPRPNFLSEGVRLGLDKEIAPDGTYLTYFPFGAMIERSRMTLYHKKLLLLERVNNNTRTQLRLKPSSLWRHNVASVSDVE